VAGIPRFVPAENYAANFGFQWNRFRRTQLDSYSGLPVSRKRFLEQTGWTQADLEGKLVLDAGCGAGRFSEIALSLGAEVVAIDYSSAIDACASNLGDNPRLHLAQADIYALPFAPETFDFIYSLGVLQHTPDVKKALCSLPPFLKYGGKLTVDLYLKNWAMWLHPRVWLRPFTTRIEAGRLFHLVERMAPHLLSLSKAVGRVPIAGRGLRRFIPVANYEGVFGLSDPQLQEWAVLDTFDWLAPKYDQPQTARTLESWLAETGLSEIEVELSHHLTGRARKLLDSPDVDGII
jgi:SAM-dependent methyltransferase